MNKTKKVQIFTIASILIFVIGMYGVMPAQASTENDNTSFSDGFLNPDGTLKLDGSISGSLNLQGWDVRVDDERGPVFSPKNSKSISPFHSPNVGDWFGLGNDTFLPNNAGAIKGDVYAIAMSGTDVYVGGRFYAAGGNLKADNIAKWDGATWSNLGDNGLIPSWRAAGAIIGTVYAIAVSGNNVYIGTDVSSVYINGSVSPQADYIAKWDDTGWSGVGGNGAGGSSLNGTVREIVVSGNNVYVGGNFTDVRNGLTTLTEADHIAKWDGTNWSALGNNGAGDGSINGPVTALAVNGNDIYVGGGFTDVKNGATTLTAADYVAKWDGVKWSALGNDGDNPANGSIRGTYASVENIGVNGNDVYVGGTFTDVNNFGTVLTTADYIAKWDGANWSALGSNGNENGALDSTVLAIEIVGSDVYAGGDFQDVNNNGNILTAADYVAKWDGVNWSALGSDGGNPPNGSLNTGYIVGSFASTGYDLFTGGYFRDINNNGTVLTNGDFIAGYHISDRPHSIYHVAPNGSYVPSCGTAWSNPCDFQYALNTLAVSGDEIWAKAGIYKPGSDRSSTFTLKDGVAIYGGLAGTETSLEQRDPRLHVTILSGDLNGDDTNTVSPGEPTRAENVLHVVSSSGVGRGAILDGFTITGGNANLDAPNAASLGGGMLNTASKPILRNLIFTRNSASFMGGGMSNELNSSPFIENVTFNNNSAGSGGGLCNSGSDPTLTNIVFDWNSASTGGGGVCNVDSEAAFFDVTFSNNSSSQEGGGMHNIDSNLRIVQGATFYQNHALEGGAVFNWNSNIVFFNATFTTNSAGNGGSVMWNEENSSPLMYFNTITGNDDGIKNVSSSPAIEYSIMWGNIDPDTGVVSTINNDPTSTTYVWDSVIQNGYDGGTNVITEDPLLGPLGNYGGKTLTIPLLSGSSAIDRCPYTSSDLDQRGVARPQGAACDLGAYEADGTVIPPPVTQSVPLLQGWNLVSFNVHPTDTSVSSVLSSIEGNYDLVYTWDATGAHAASGNWLKADNVPASPDSLTLLNETMGFWVHMTAADTLEVVGTVPPITNVPLLDNVGGWNLVSYPSVLNQDLPTALAGTDFSLVYAYHPEDSRDTWKLYDTSAPPIVNDLTQLVPGFGYWVNVSADRIWVVKYDSP